MGPRLRQFADPAVVCSVVLLLLNDRVLKGNGSGWLTGKLSDFAGVFLVAMTVGIVTARPDVGVATTALGFVAIKLSYGAAQLTAPVLGGVTRQDHTDLVALLALVPAWRVLRRSPSPLASGSFGALAATVCLMFAGVGVTATSCEAPDSVDALAVDGNGNLVARIDTPDYGPGPDELWAASVDGGVNWRPIVDPALTVTSGQPACDHAGHCFRVVEGERVEQADGNGEWRTAFEFTAKQERTMRVRQRMCGPTTDDSFRSVIVVDAQPQTRVIVAMGSQGVLIRGSDSQWHRYAVLDRKPLSVRGPLWLQRAGLAPLVGVLFSVVVYRIGRKRGGKARARELANQAAILQAALIAVSLAMIFVGVDFVIGGKILLLATTLGLLISIGRAFMARPRPIASTYPPPPPAPRVLDR